ncbi:MAG: hypothetical protein B6D39_06120 [Anaerolineae bacterium UTCFX2]|jgi:Cd2+/Zn2+-exporting ATPase|nr:cation-translocating P-type ATPase [Anaerolineae bacterium]MCZ7551682.1 cation-translocating P-type ATPase [Anaerolineales bacterium]OQY91731.1 MAG: hypothetical protein B6D39_06120 [Anaerolineae bacterium UTCFX2]
MKKMNLVDAPTPKTGTHTTRMILGGMDCSDCEIVLEHRLKRMDGVIDVEANFNDRSLEVEYDRRQVSRRLIEKRVRQMGYEPEPGRLARWIGENAEILLSLVSGLLLFLGWTGRLSRLLPPGSETWFYVGAYLPAGYVVGREVLHSLRSRQFDTDLLMFAAALGAASLGQFAEGAILLFLFSLGHALQERALGRAREAVRALARLAPRLALARRDGREDLLPVEKLTLEDLVIVRAGERLPVDGEVVLGQSYVDESPITGESLPVEKSPGTKVFAGSLNADGTLEVRVTRLAQDSTLARVLKMVEQAQGSRSPIQLKVEQFTRIFVPIALAVFLFLLAYPVLAGLPFKPGFITAVTFLVATSPCALALGTPSAILSGIAQAARNGVLVKGGAYLEQLGGLKAVAFDKTGTLTLGKPHVTEVVALPGQLEEDILELAASVEGRSNHPLAQAIIDEAAERGLKPTAAAEVENLTGRGMRARQDGRVVWVGGMTLWEEQSLKLPESLRQRIQELEAQGKTVVLVGDAEGAVGLIAITDTLRPEAAAVVRALPALGVDHTVMLSGDNRRAAAEIAAQVGLSEYRAELLPEEKLASVNELVQAYGSVGMVGDGINDAPALAQATVGIALGSAQNDIALEAADVALMAPDLRKLPFAIGLGKAVQRITLQNLVVSLGSILILAGLSLAGALGIGATVLLHEGTTLLVVANALRLFGFKQGDPTLI